jgi:putative transcriptional regulator
MSGNIDHHLDTATLMAYSAGSLGEALSAVASAHIEMCEHCREELAVLDDVGAALLNSLPSKTAGMPSMPTLSQPSGSVVALIAKSGTRSAARVRRPSTKPAAFGARLGIDLGNIAWRRLGPGVWHYPVKLSPGVTGDLRLLKIAAGRQMPVHGHGGTELTLVLEGAYRDENGRYGCGDVQDLDGEHEHQPVADPETGCVCIVASEKPARYRSLVNRLLQPLTGL